MRSGSWLEAGCGDWSINLRRRRRRLHVHDAVFCEDLLESVFSPDLGMVYDGRGFRFCQTLGLKPISEIAEQVPEQCLAAVNDGAAGAAS